MGFDIQDRTRFEIVERTCDFCHKPQQMMRMQKFCDECVRKEQEKFRAIALVHAYKAHGIPSRYIGYRLPEEYKYLAGKSCIIYGAYGTGKTHLACQLLKEKMGWFFRATSLVETGSRGDYDNPIWRIAPLICIDDLGKIASTDSKLERMFTIIDTRYTEKKTTIITVDMIGADIVDAFGRWGMAIVSRIDEMMVRVALEKVWRKSLSEEN